MAQSASGELVFFFVGTRGFQPRMFSQDLTHCSLGTQGRLVRRTLGHCKPCSSFWASTLLNTRSARAKATFEVSFQPFCATLLQGLGKPLVKVQDQLVLSKVALASDRAISKIGRACCTPQEWWMQSTPGRLAGKPVIHLWTMRAGPLARSIRTTRSTTGAAAMMTCLSRQLSRARRRSRSHRDRVISPRRAETALSRRDRVISPRRTETTLSRRDRVISPRRTETALSRRDRVISPQRTETALSRRDRTISPRRTETALSRRDRVVSPRRTETALSRRDRVISPRRTETALSRRDMVISPARTETALSRRDRVVSPRRTETALSRRDRVISHRRTEKALSRRDRVISHRRTETALSRRDIGRYEPKQPYLAEIG